MIEKGVIIIDEDKYKSFKQVQSVNGIRRFTRWLIALFVVIFIIMLLPWTQNVGGYGKLTTLRPEQRPQTINSTISGKIDKWNVIEGQHVRAGDTLVKITEVKDAYFDPRLIERTQLQLEAKKLSLKSYDQKVTALENQLVSLNQEYGLKLKQGRNKLQQAKMKLLSDSTNYAIAMINFDIAAKRLNRADSLYVQGIVSLVKLEERQLKFQDATNKRISSENKYMISQNQLINAEIDLNNINNTYLAKISKGESDKYSAQSALFDARAQVAKMENQLTNYTIRQGYYHIIAPVDGYIVKTYKPGSGEIVKEGTPIVEFMPINIEIAAEIYIRPMDLPLIKIGEKTRLTFDGWPSLVFSGWPSTSFGTFGGEVYAIDRVASKNGRFRVLVIPDPLDEEWPTLLRVGSGATSIFLLNEVPVYYELWRQINGFPPEYYDGSKSKYDLDESLDSKYHTK